MLMAGYLQYIMHCTDKVRLKWNNLKDMFEIKVKYSIRFVAKYTHCLQNISLSQIWMKGIMSVGVFFVYCLSNWPLIFA